MKLRVYGSRISYDTGKLERAINVFGRGVPR